MELINIGGEKKILNDATGKTKRKTPSSNRTTGKRKKKGGGRSFQGKETKLQKEAPQRVVKKGFPGIFKKQACEECGGMGKIIKLSTFPSGGKKEKSR